MLARIRIGHSYATHSYLLKKEDQPQCVACNSPLTVKHIMLDCVDFDLVRTDYFNVDSMKELFEKVQADSILAYVYLLMLCLLVICMSMEYKKVATLPRVGIGASP